MLKKRTTSEENPETGETLTTTTRYDGTWTGILLDDAVILIKLGDEEIANTTLNVPSGKELHIKISVSSILADVTKEIE